MLNQEIIECLQPQETEFRRSIAEFTEREIRIIVPKYLGDWKGKFLTHFKNELINFKETNLKPDAALGWDFLRKNRNFPPENPEGKISRNSEFIYFTGARIS